MTSTWKRAAIGVAFTTAALVGATAPAFAGDDSAASLTTTRTFYGIGGSVYRTVAISQAKEDARDQAAAANAIFCTFTNEEIDDDGSGFIVAIEELTCLR